MPGRMPPGPACTESARSALTNRPWPRVGPTTLPCGPPGAPRRGDRALSACVVTLHAPELDASRLLGVPAVAAAGISSSTLRAYISRGDCDVPPPQAVVGRRSLWVRPVAEEWAEQCCTVVQGLVTSALDTAGLSPGAADTQHAFARVFFEQLWQRPEVRKRWSTRHRTEEEVRQVADELGRVVAARLDDILPAEALAATLTSALLNALNGRTWPGEDRASGIDPSLTAMLRRLDRQHPGLALQVIRDVAASVRLRCGTAPAHTDQLLHGLLDDRGGGESVSAAGPPAAACLERPNSRGRGPVDRTGERGRSGARRDRPLSAVAQTVSGRRRCTS